MNCTNCGSPLAHDDAFCTACGTKVEQSPSGGAGVPAQAPPPTAPAQPAAPADHGQVPQQQPIQVQQVGGPEDPSTKRSTKKILMIAVPVVLLVAAAAVVVFFVLGDDDGGSISTGGEYRGPDRDLMILVSDSGDTAIAKHGSEDRPIEFLRDDYFDSAELIPLAGGGDITDRGGPILGASHEDDGDDVAVIQVDADDGTITELLDGGDDYDVYFDPGRRNVLVVETGSSSERCYAGELGEEPLRIARSDDCRFSASGAYAIASEYDDDSEEYEFEIVDLDGNTVYTGDSLDRPVLIADDTRILTREGSSDRPAIKVTELATGDIVAETDRVSKISVLDINLNGDVAIAWHDDDEAVLEVITRAGVIEEVITGFDALSAGFLDDGNSDLLVAVLDDEESQLSIATASTDGYELDEVLDDVEELYTLPAGRRDGLFTAVSQEEDDEDAILLVKTDAGLVEIDLDDYSYVDSASLSADGSTLVFDIGSSNDDGSFESILRVDLADGTEEWVLEEWSYVSVRDMASDGSSLLVSGQEDSGDDDAIAVVDSSGSTDIFADGQTIDASIFDADESSAIYTIREDDDVDLYEYELGERGRPATLHGGYSLRSAGWSNPPVRLRYAGGLFEGPSEAPNCRSEYPGMQTIAPGESSNGSISSYDQASYCLEIDEGGYYTLTVSSDFDSILEVTGNGTNYYNDDYEGIEPLIDEYFDPGAYEVVVSGFDENSGSYTLYVS